MLKTETPCCGHAVRLRVRPDALLEGYERRCCGNRWYVERTLDELAWHQVDWDDAEVEERALITVPKDQALTAYRAWDADRGGGLYSLYYDRDTPWKRTMRIPRDQVIERDPQATSGHEFGFHAYKTLRTCDTLRPFAVIPESVLRFHNLVPFFVGPLIGTARIWGVIAFAKCVFRAEYCSITGLCERDEGTEDLVKLVATNYGLTKHEGRWWQLPSRRTATAAAKEASDAVR